MSVEISQTELALLTYLYKHSGDSGERIWLDPKPIMHDLRISTEQFIKAWGTLAAHGLAGVRSSTPETTESRSMSCSAIWLTRKGKDYLKALPPGPAQQGLLPRTTCRA
jgi:hypothetical protein